MADHHLYKQFDNELNAIRSLLTRMGGLVEEQFNTVLKSLSNFDQTILEKIINRDKEVDEMEITLDDSCINIIARRQPTAVDLRVVMSAGKTVTDLERIGDEAKKIANSTLKIFERGGTLSQVIEVRQMGERVQMMLHYVLDAYARLDVEAAEKIKHYDRDINHNFRAIVRKLITFMMEDPRTISSVLDMVFIAKSIERIGDHCKNIAEDIIYVVKGRDVRHKHDIVE